MGADAKLIDAVTRAEYAKNPIDLSKYFQQTMSVGPSIMAGVAGAVKIIGAKQEKEVEKQEKEAKELQIKRKYEAASFDRETRDLLKILKQADIDLSTNEAGGNEMKDLNGKMTDLQFGVGTEIRNGINQIRQEIETGGKTYEHDKRILELETRGRKFVKQVTQLRGDLLTLAKLGGDNTTESNINWEASYGKDGGKNLHILKMIADTNGNWEGITPDQDENGNLVLDIDKTWTDPQDITHEIKETLPWDQVRDLPVYDDDASRTANNKIITEHAEDLKNPYIFNDVMFEVGENIHISGPKENINALIHGNSIYGNFAEDSKLHPILLGSTYEMLRLKPEKNIFDDKTFEDLDINKDKMLQISEDGTFEDGETKLSKKTRESLYNTMVNPKTPEEKAAMALELAQWWAMKGNQKREELLAQQGGTPQGNITDYQKSQQEKILNKNMIDTFAKTRDFTNLNIPSWMNPVEDKDQYMLSGKVFAKTKEKAKKLGIPWIGSWEFMKHLYMSFNIPQSMHPADWKKKFGSGATVQQTKLQGVALLTAGVQAKSRLK